MENRGTLYIFRSLFIGLIIFNLIIILPISMNLKTQIRTASPNSSNFGIINHQIHINNNWTDSVISYGFITGAGTLNNPYKIENVTIVNNLEGDSIVIENSKDYFMVRNCTIKNSGVSDTDVQVKIINSTKGTLINNTISSNVGSGIRLIGSYNNSILDNVIVNNTHIGIGLNESNNNIINDNVVNYHGKESVSGFGISLVFSDNNSISRNTASYNTAIGILLYNSSYNNITSNSANENYQGLLLSHGSNYNNVIANDLSGNEYCYSEDSDSEDNTLTNNYCGSVGFEYYFFIIIFGIVFIASVTGLIIVIRKRRKLKKEGKKLR